MVLNPPGRDMGGDDPPYSRLFVVYNRKDPVTEQELRDDFGEFGEVQDIFIVKDKATMEPKGLAYIKFSKMSEAAIAMESLNQQPIKNKSGIYKVYIAKNKGEAKGADEDPDRYLRLFVMVPKTATESDIKMHFSKFGDVQTVKLLRNRETNESKGIGYVTYSKVSEAAFAVEEGENGEGFKAVIARPKEKNPPYPSDSYGPSSSSNNSTRGSHKYPDLQSTCDFFTAQVSAKLNKDHIYRLFDIAPGLRDIDIVSQNMYRSEVVATYKSTLAAEYALNKLHGLEYPLGEFISVESKVVNKRPPPTSGNSYKSRETTNSYSGASYSGSLGASGSSGKRDYRGDYRADPNDYGDESPSHSDSNPEVNQKLAALSKALTDATALLKSAGLTPGLATESLGLKMPSAEPKSSYSPYCDFPVPPTQPVQSKTDFDEETGMRLFFVGHPSAPSMEALYDVYCRYGNFAGATVMARKNYGYLYFTTAESAHKAIKATDDKMIAGVSIKVLKADPKKNDSTQKRKRVRTEI